MVHPTHRAREKRGQKGLLNGNKGKGGGKGAMPAGGGTSGTAQARDELAGQSINPEQKIPDTHTGRDNEPSTMRDDAAGIQRNQLAMPPVNVPVENEVLYAPQSDTHSGLEEQSVNVDRRFLMKMTSDCMLEIEVGDIASELGVNGAVIQFGEDMSREHARMLEDLRQIADRKGIAVPRDLNNLDRERLVKMTGLAGTEFDRQYINLEIRRCEDNVAWLQSYLSQAEDLDIKRVAEQMTGLLQQNARRARELGTVIGG
jgi:putative membrane protein